MSNPNADKQERILKYYQELATFAQQANQGKTALTQAKAQIELAKADADLNAQKQLAQQVAHIERITTVATKMATEKANRPDLAGVEDLLGQIEARLSHYGELLKETRMMDAQFELAVSMGEFAEGAPGATRADVEAQIAQAKAKATKQLELADALVPSKPILLSLN